MQPKYCLFASGLRDQRLRHDLRKTSKVSERSLFMAGVATKKQFFLGKHFADPTIKKFTNFSPNLKYQLKNKYPPLAKSCRTCHTFMPQLSHMSFTTSVT
jgi:hypothetical protein